MRFGVFILGDKPSHLTHQQVFANVLEEARWAEELGYDEIWLAEHHFSPYGTLADLPLMKTPSSFEWLADKGFGAIIGNPYQVDPDLQGALDIYLETQAKKGLAAATGNVWALLNAFCHPDD